MSNTSRAYWSDPIVIKLLNGNSDGAIVGEELGLGDDDGTEDMLGEEVCLNDKVGAEVDGHLSGKL